jgi:hypothetical protein
LMHKRHSLKHLPLKRRRNMLRDFRGCLGIFEGVSAARARNEFDENKSR